MTEAENTPAAQTIGALIAESLKAPVKRGQVYGIYDIAGEGFENYQLRVKRPGDTGLKEVRRLLETTTSLTVPDFFFIGPEVSQSLLNFGDKADDIPVLEIIRKNTGRTLDSYLTSSEASGELMEKLVNNPQSIYQVMQHVAFSRLHTATPLYADYSQTNIKVAEDGALSLVNVMAQQSLRRTFQGLGTADPQERAVVAVNEFSKTLELLAQSNPKHPQKDAFLQVMDDVRHQVSLDIGSNHFTAAYPEWTGFQRLKQKGGELDAEGKISWKPAGPYNPKDIAKGAIRIRLVSAVALNDPPAKLKLALDRLYAEAVPERA